MRVVIKIKADHFVEKQKELKALEFIWKMLENYQKTDEKLHKDIENLCKEGLLEYQIEINGRDHLTQLDINYNSIISLIEDFPKLCSKEGLPLFFIAVSYALQLEPIAIYAECLRL